MTWVLGSGLPHSSLCLVCAYWLPGIDIASYLVLSVVLCEDWVWKIGRGHRWTAGVAIRIVCRSLREVGV